MTVCLSLLDIILDDVRSFTGVENVSLRCYTNVSGMRVYLLLQLKHCNFVEDFLFLSGPRKKTALPYSLILMSSHQNGNCPEITITMNCVGKPYMWQRDNNNNKPSSDNIISTTFPLMHSQFCLNCSFTQTDIGWIKGWE